ncbi:MAG: hypothetical protein MZV65_54310 [Chromatiales bacterium]|nr:hypothetical protein [Chromatiales bacterium]
MPRKRVACRSPSSHSRALAGIEAPGGARSRCICPTACRASPSSACPRPK